MRFFEQIETIRKFTHGASASGKCIGLVPTMGALHEGHLALLRKSVEENDITVASIYVNPTQFNREEDLKSYPRELDRDQMILEKIGCDALFAPSDGEMYPQGTTDFLNLSFNELESRLEGAFRPGHFQGVGLVVGKLFNIVRPDRAYFGLKDYQQYLIIHHLSNALNFGVEVIGIETVRETDGLAMSSRNQGLSQEEREIAPQLHKALQLAALQLQEGISSEEALNIALEHIRQHSQFHLEYLDVSDADTLKPMDQIKKGQTALISIAAFLGKVRLIDNVRVKLT